MSLAQNSQNQLISINFDMKSFYANSDAFFCLFDENILPDIIILTETWFKHDNTWDMNGFSSYHTIRNHARSVGISPHAKNKYVSAVIPDICEKNIQIFSVSVQIDNSSINILGIYIGSIENFNQSLSTILV